MCEHAREWLSVLPGHPVRHDHLRVRRTALPALIANVCRRHPRPPGKATHRVCRPRDVACPGTRATARRPARRQRPASDARTGECLPDGTRAHLWGRCYRSSYRRCLQITLHVTGDAKVVADTIRRLRADPGCASMSRFLSRRPRRLSGYTATGSSVLVDRPGANIHRAFPVIDLQATASRPSGTRADYNSEIATYRFAAPGAREIQWRLGALASNVLQLRAP